MVKGDIIFIITIMNLTSKNFAKSALTIILKLGLENI